MQKRNVDIVGIHFDNRPLTDFRPLEKTKRLLRKLNISKLYIIEHGKNQLGVIKDCNRRYMCVICRRFMFRIAEKIAEKEKCDFLITGENLGQVASQTLDNLAVTNKAVKMTILRPLLCNDKQETMDLAKEIGTYDISIEPPGCCKAVPRNPVTKANMEKLEHEEKRINIKEMVKNSVDTAKLVVL
jgi:thiamine biosynthesis protein ThiI